MESLDENGFTQQQINNFMKIAIQQGRKAFNCDQVPVGCIFVTKSKDNPEWRVISQSHNLTNSFKNATRHCQINCIAQMSEKITEQEHENLVLFVSVEPCIMCTYALNMFNVKFVYFGQFNDKFGGCGSVLERNEFKFKGGIMCQQSYELIKSFYERGNLRISEQMRNKKRKKVKTAKQQQENLQQK